MKQAAARSPPGGDDPRRPRLVGVGRACCSRSRRGDGRRPAPVPAAPTARSCSTSRLDRVLEPGDPELGWLAKRRRPRARLPRRPGKTAQTYPVIDGVRYVVPGDRAQPTSRRHASSSTAGTRSTINSGGEKIFAEEVEAALKAHPGGLRLPRGRPAERALGQEVVAIVQLRPGADARPDEQLQRGRRRRTSPGSSCRRPSCSSTQVVRSPRGKADYRWADRPSAPRHGERTGDSCRRPWDGDELPTGRGQGARGARDVRHHRPALRPGQPGHDVPARRAVATTSGHDPRLCRPAAGSLDLASGTGDLCIELRAPGLRPISVDLSLRHAGRRPQRRAAGAGRHPAPPVPRRVASTA